MLNAPTNHPPAATPDLLIWEYNQSTGKFCWRLMDNPDREQLNPLDYYSAESRECLLKKIGEITGSLPYDLTYTFTDIENSHTLLLPQLSASGVTILGVILINRPGVFDPGRFLSDRTIRNVLNFLPIDLVLFDTRQRFLFVSDHSVKDPETRKWMIGKTEIDFFQRRQKPLDLPLKRKEYFAKMLTEKKTVTYLESDIVNGRKIYKSRSFHPILNEEGNIYLVVGYGIDTTHNVEKEAIIQSQNMAIEKASDGIALLDPNGKYYYLNDAHVKLYGYNSNLELIGKTWRELYAEEERKRIEHKIWPTLVKKGNWKGETIGISKLGTPVYLEITLSVLPNGDVLCICRDFSERKKQADEIRKLALVVENTNSVVIIADNQGRIEWVNQAFTKLTGYELEEVLGKYPGSLLQGPATDEVTKKYLREKVLAQQSFECEIINYKKNGEPYWVKIQGQPLPDPDGNVFKYFSIMEDITYRKHIERDLIIAKEAAEASSRLKRRFLANMSHEIRTPMNAILGLTEQLLKTGMSTEQRFLSETISSAANNLLAVINDILDISRIEEGKVQLEFIQMNPKHVLERSINVLQHKAEEKGLNLKTALDASLDQEVLGDPYRMNQILLNIIGNGIKFTDRGHVLIEGWIESQEPKKILRLTITDTGIGMDEGMKNNLFAEFTQGDQSFARKYGGSGLGLSITRNLIELMQGYIYIESELNRGTTVHISIPYNKITEPGSIKDSNAGFQVPNLAGKKVMLVEDNKFNSLVASMILKKTGVDTILCYNGIEAVELLKTESVDLILMDIQMPEMDGVTSTGMIRNELKVRTPIIALTAHALREEKEIYLEVGMNDFLSKPFTETELVVMLSKWIR